MGDGCVCGEKAVGGEDDGKWQLGDQKEKVSSCKLKGSGKDWLLPNIQSREQLAFAAAEGEEMVSKPEDSATDLYGLVRVHAPLVQRVVHP